MLEEIRCQTIMKVLTRELDNPERKKLREMVDGV
jgi:hypothetical protein